ncbi:unknown [Firmicutes bacterium CAG:884]|nr:unknown [Firmicutes bacterium CAG:884]
MNNFITIYSLVLKDFSFDNNKYEINVNYNEEKSIFDVSIFNITHNINSFYKSIIIDKENAIKLKNIIRLNFIDNYDIYLPGIQILDKKTIHKIKNHKFTLNIDILPYEVNETYNIQKKALKKMKN